MREFTTLEKIVLGKFFTSVDEKDTVYAAKSALPQEIVAYIIGRASRATDTFREIFLELWEDAAGEYYVDFKDNPNKEILDKISEKAFNFLNKFKLHNSLRDVPHVAVFCDELSILETKVWEHEVVAEYQEKSTRYKPFVASNVYLPNGISGNLEDKIREGHKRLIEVYNNIYNDTGKRDLARYLLPVGSKTAMASMANIRAWERIVGRMSAYPTHESKDLAEKITYHIRQVFGGTEISFSINEEYVKQCKKDFAFIRSLSKVKNQYITLPQEQEVSIKKIYGEPVYKIDGIIDIGAHRDLQRQRSVIQNIPDYRPIYGYDKLIKEYISEDLYQAYSKCMVENNELYWETFNELLDLENIGEIQYISLLGHMTKFWYITNEERWRYVHDLRTGAPTQKSTSPKTVHFSYSSWCKRAQQEMDKLNGEER